jgi:hypothetical protein
MATTPQFKVFLPPEMEKRLRAAADQQGVSIAEEIRQRVEQTFAGDDLDAVTRELRDGLVNVAAKLSADFGSEWHASPRAYEAFAAGIAQRLAGYKPPPPLKAEGVGASDIFALHDEPADVIGRMREHDDRREHDYPQLKSATARRQRTLTAQGIKASRKGDKS